MAQADDTANLDEGNKSGNSSFEELLAMDGFLTYRVQGCSMEPMLFQNRDVITVRSKKPGERFAENDVVLYYRKRDRKYTLHRIVEVCKDSYVILGDNCFVLERGIKDEDILGVLVSFQRDGKFYDVNDSEYLKYVAKLRRNQDRRIAFGRGKARVKAVVKRLPLVGHLKRKN